jgi:exodeoxyribonuclease-3
MRVITLNVNGVRAAKRKGFFEWVKMQNADVICLQETKTQLENLKQDEYCLDGYHCYYDDANRPGYSGVAIYCKQKPQNIIKKLGWKYSDEEGRYLQVDFGALSVVSLYLPSGSSGELRQEIKFDFMKHFYEHLKKMNELERNFIICGDWNIVHKEIDIKNFKSNQKHSGCLPEERAWLDDVFNQLTFVDAFRAVNQEPHQYTWWSNRGKAWEKNVGWRIDYQVLTANLKNKIQAVSIYKEQRFSDHAPLIVDYDVVL